MPRIRPIPSLLSRFVHPRGQLLPAEVSSAIVERGPAGILVADVSSSDARITYVNDAFEAITGYARDEAIGKNCRYLQGSDRLQPEVAVIREALTKGVATDVRLRNYRKDGSLFWNDLHLVPVGAGVPTHYVGFMRDVTQVVATASRLERTIHVDRLTGCLNRDTLVEQLSSRTAARCVLLVKLDIARFHEINAGYGYDVGDALLRAVADRLSTLQADLVARVGNDQFALAFAVDGRLGAPFFLDRLTKSLAARFALPGADLMVCFAIGFVIGTPGADAMTLVRQAGAALADSKMSALRKPCEFAVERAAKAHHRLRMTAELQQALSNDDFIYHFQPQVDLTSGEIVGAEALIRWQHPLFGLQQPGRFVSLAEETGLILDIGAAGLRSVAQFAAGLNLDRAKLLCFSFNVSPIELTHRDMVTFVGRVIDETGVAPACLTLELTEGLLAESSPEMLRIFNGLRELGIGLSIDDFGTGYSSLSYLERFPLTEIKIDRSFVSGLPSSAAKRVIVEAVIKLGCVLGVRVVSEGVERETERDLLREMGCSLAQGYLFSPPLSAADFRNMARCDGAETRSSS